MSKQRFQTKWRFIGVKELTSHIAKWAVSQSPYECPHNLVAAIRALHKRAHFLLASKSSVKLKKWGFVNMTEKQVKQVVEALVFGTPEIQCWNRCRKGKTPDILATSIYWGKPHPDSDFIDMHALVLNVMLDLRSKWAGEDRDKAEFELRTAQNKTSTKLCVAPPQCATVTKK